MEQQKFKSKEEVREALKVEYERRVGLPIVEFEDVDAWVEEVWSGDWTVKESVDYVIEKYDLTDLDGPWARL